MDRQNAANALKADSATLADRARDLDVPDELKSAQDYFVESLELRRDALSVIAAELPGALAQEERRSSTGRIAQMMQVFVGERRAAEEPLRRRPQGRAREGGHRAPRRQGPGQLTFLTNLDWLQPDFVADQIAGIRGSAAAAPTPGLHGNGLGTVSLGGVALTPGGSATVQLTQDTAFDVQVVNQGESTETDVGVTVTVGPGGDADRGRGDDRRDRRRRGEERDHPAFQAAAHRAERGHHGERRSRCRARGSRTTTRPSSRSSSPAEPH